MAFIDLVTWIAAGGLIVAWLIISNWLYCYYRLRCTEQITKRHPHIVLIVAFLLFFDVMIKPVLLLSANGQLPHFWLPGNVWVYITCCLTTVLSMYLLVYRAYITYFEIQWNLAMDNSQWRLSIDPEETNWFLANKQQWGESTKPLLVLMTIYLPLTALSLFCALNDDLFQYARYLVVINILTINMLSIVLFFKFPRFDDIWNIGKEIKIGMPSIVIPTIIYLIMNVSIKIEFPSPLGVITAYISATVDIALLYSSTYYVLCSYKLPTNIVSLRWFLNDLPKLEKGYVSSMSTTGTDRQKSEARRKKMIEILQDYNGFDAFARHLSREFSVECILFFVETTQWIRYVLEIMKCEGTSTDPEIDDNDRQYRFTDLLSIRFPDSAPKSSFVDFKVIEPSKSHTKRMSLMIPMHLEGPILPRMLPSSSASRSKSRTSSDVSTTMTMTSMSDKEDSPAPNSRSRSPSPSPRMSNEDIEKCYWSAVKLFEKYVTNDAYFSVNISFGDRQRLYKLMGYSDAAKYDTTEQMMQDLLMKHCEFDLKQLIHVFDASRYAVYKLMDQSCNRFTKTDEYKKYFDVE